MDIHGYLQGVGRTPLTLVGIALITVIGNKATITPYSWQ